MSSIPQSVRFDRVLFRRGLAALMSASLLAPASAGATILDMRQIVEADGPSVALQAALNQFFDNSKQRDKNNDPVDGARSVIGADKIFAAAGPQVRVNSAPRNIPMPVTRPVNDISLGERVLGVFHAANAFFFRQVNGVAPWYTVGKIPFIGTALAVLNLAGLRHDLREKNLQSTSQLDANRNQTSSADCARWKEARSPNGICNDLGDPDRGRAGLPSVGSSRWTRLSASFRRIGSTSLCHDSSIASLLPFPWRGAAGQADGQSRLRDSPPGPKVRCMPMLSMFCGGCNQTA